MPYFRTLGTLGELDFNQEVTFEQCQAIINHQAPGGLDTQFACASRGWHGNAAWSKPQPPPPMPPIPQLQMAVQPTVIQPPPIALSPRVIIPDPPQLFEETVNTLPDCSGFDAWVSENKALALGIAALIYFVR